VPTTRSSRETILHPRAFSILAGLSLFVPWGARATTVGPILELTAGAGAQRAPALSWDPVEQVYVIVWEDARHPANGIDLYAARLGPDGALRDPAGIALLEASVLADNETQPAIAYAPGGGGRLAHHVIAWTEARAGFPDIFAARFFAGGGTTTPANGLQLTSGSDSEGFPAVAVGGQRALVVFQANVAGGFTVRGRRLDGDLAPVDPAPFAVSAGSFDANPAVAVAGSSFVVGWEAGADLFGRSLPEVGGVGGPITPSTISSSTGAESRVSLAPLGTGVIAAWQDARRGASDRELFARRLSSSAAQVGGESVLSSAPNDQLRPIVAGHASGGLAVWQDRRGSTAVGLIFGARLDAAGTVLDAEGLPLLAFIENSLEHTVVKGPGADYLVAAVRFGATPRIFYRLVRDEPPAGLVTALGPTSVAADGTSRAELVFGPARGASGLVVADGTLFTVMLSSTRATLVSPDAAPRIPGHQVQATGGELQVSLSSLVHELVDVMVVSVEGSASGQAMVEFLNVPPVARAVTLGPTAPSSAEALTLSYRFDDVNQDAEAGTRITWTRNASLQAQLADQTTVPPSQTRRGDQWRASVRPRDGLAFGAEVFSNTVTVGNTPPMTTSLAIVPATGVRTGTALRVRWTVDDDDNDPAGPLSELRWFDRGVEQADLLGALELAPSRVQKGQSWSVSARPHDGLDFGALTRSATVGVENSPPTADAGGRRTVTERRRLTLDGRGSRDLDPQDVLRFAWSQVRSGQEPEVALSSTSSPTPSFLAPAVEGTTLFAFELVVSDGEAESPPARVSVEVAPVADADRDGLDDEEEQRAGSDPATADSDRDGLKDGEEVRAGLSPLDEDSDDDGVRDGAEGQSCRNCADARPTDDADGDLAINALDADADGDGLFDGTELGIREPLGGGGAAPFAYLGTDLAAGHFRADDDPATATDPNLRDTDGDRLDDGVEDADRDGRLDSGESDPTDPEDPGIACAGPADCPAGLTCGAGGLCRVGSGDAGLTCSPLPEAVECCMGGCQGGTAVDAVCLRQGASEQCPLGATQCNAGACSAPPAPRPAGSEGCGCTTVDGEGRTASPIWSFALALLLFARGARRRAGRPAA
jgi:hypothetical protein